MRSARLEYVPAQSPGSDAAGQGSCEGYTVVMPGTRRRSSGGAGCGVDEVVGRCLVPRLHVAYSSLQARRTAAAALLCPPPAPAGTARAATPRAAQAQPSTVLGQRCYRASSRSSVRGSAAATSSILTRLRAPATSVTERRPTPNAAATEASAAAVAWPSAAGSLTRTTRAPSCCPPTPGWADRGRTRIVMRTPPVCTPARPDKSVRSNRPIRGVALNRRNRFVTSDRGVIPVWLLAPFDLRYGSG
jgi:hypothetical protein